MEDSQKRRRIKTTRFEQDMLENDEQRLLQQAIKNSLVDRKRVDVPVDEAPTYRPTLEEFADPYLYIKKIRPEAERYGICKIVPPKEWKPRCQLDYTDPTKMKPFPTRLQNISTLQESEGFDDGKKYTLPDYKAMADEFYRSWVARHYGDRAEEVTEEELARDYWKIVETRSEEVHVEYGNDLHTDEYLSGFPLRVTDNNNNNDSSTPTITGANTSHGATNTGPTSSTTHVTTPSCLDSDTTSSESDTTFNESYYRETAWNLTNFPMHEASLLKFVKTPVAGVTVPWLYIGMLFSSFCWHNEDNYMYSVNYSHLGATKQWYGVPAAEAKKFERASRESFLESFKDSPDLLHHMTTQISPSLLITKHVPVYRAQQEAGTFIITFPKAYHCGFSYGFNCGEAVNFAPVDWIGIGAEAEDNYRLLGRGAVLSQQRVMFTLLHHLDEFKLDMSRGLLETFARDIIRIADEELYSRPAIVSHGVQDMTGKVRLPANDFNEISPKALEYDDLKTCTFCKHVCVFTAVACTCDSTKVACIRHYRDMCKHSKCPVTKRFMLCWTTNDALKAAKSQMDAILKQATT